MPRNKLGPVKCSARAKTTGERCDQWAMRGGTVCRMHGGEAPQVRSKAEERIKALVNPALALIEEYLEHAGDPEYPVPPAVRLRAAESILDRAGYSATHKLDARIEGDIHVREVSELDRRIDALLGRMASLDRSGQGPSRVAAGGETEPADPAR